MPSSDHEKLVRLSAAFSEIEKETLTVDQLICATRDKSFVKAVAAQTSVSESDVPSRLWSARVIVSEAQTPGVISLITIGKSSTPSVSDFVGTVHVNITDLL